MDIIIINLRTDIFCNLVTVQLHLQRHTWPQEWHNSCGIVNLYSLWESYSKVMTGAETRLWFMNLFLNRDIWLAASIISLLSLEFPNTGLIFNNSAFYVSEFLKNIKIALLWDKIKKISGEKSWSYSSEWWLIKSFKIQRNYIEIWVHINYFTTNKHMIYRFHYKILCIKNVKTNQIIGFIHTSTLKQWRKKKRKKWGKVLTVH